MHLAEKSGSQLRILYAAGPGDVIGTYEHWKAGREDPSEMSKTYSGQFFTVCRELGASARVFVTRAGGRRLADGAFVIEERLTPFQSSPSAVLFHFGQLCGAVRLAWNAVRFRADVAVVLEGTHWFALTLLRMCGVRVIPDIHCTLWPMGHPATRPSRRVIMWLNGWFWRMIPQATLCISPECKRQIRQISNGRARNLIATRPSYARGTLDHMAAPSAEGRPFILLYAGRIERDKGVFDLFEAMRRLEAAKPGAFRCVICGGGTAYAELLETVEKHGLSGVVRLAGQLRQPEMIREVERSHALIVPTTASFAEGLNRVAVESILAGRPVILTTVCPAAELILGAAISVKPGDVAAMCDAAFRLEADHAFYESKRMACVELANQFYDVNGSWGAGLKRAIKVAMPARFSANEGAGQPA